PGLCAVTTAAPLSCPETSPFSWRSAGFLPRCAGNRIPGASVDRVLRVGGPGDELTEERLDSTLSAGACPGSAQRRSGPGPRPAIGHRSGTRYVGRAASVWRLE